MEDNVMGAIHLCIILEGIEKEPFPVETILLNLIGIPNSNPDVEVHGISVVKQAEISDDAYSEHVMANKDKRPETYFA